MNKYCKNFRCPENKGEPCKIANDCWLFQWDIDKEKQPKVKTVSAPLEEDEQKEFALWLDSQGVLWAHIPNERKASVAVLSSLSRQGLKKGFPDNFIAVARGKWHGLFIELKRAKKCLSNRTKEQRAWIKSLNAAGYKAVFCYGAEEAKKTVLEYLKEEKK